MYVSYQIGHEALNGKISVPGVRAALRKQPACATEILIASITETLETRPNASGIQDALDMLREAAKHIDGAGSAPRK